MSYEFTIIGTPQWDVTNTGIPPEITIANPDALDVIVLGNGVALTQVGIPGPPGQNGQDGQDAIGNRTFEEAVFAVVTNQAVFTLLATPIVDTLDMFVNGLRQARSNFSFIGSTVTVSGFTPTTGDEVTFTYQLEA
jgi:hypothetical protein